MKLRPALFSVGCAVLLAGATCLAEVKVVVDHNDNDTASAQFKFPHVPTPAKQNAARDAKFSIVEGERDPNGGELDVLHDGLLPAESDQPANNFFYQAQTEGGRIVLDLGKSIRIRHIDTYSWHPGSRAPQVYEVYASEGRGSRFDAAPKKDADLAKSGWKLIANVDTRPKEGDAGGQYGVDIADSHGYIGDYRYLLFDIARTEDSDEFGNTFYSEIVVSDQTAPAKDEPVAEVKPFVIKSTDGKCEITIDTSGAPDLADWADHKLAPVLAEWYPKLTAMLPSPGYTPPDHFTVTIRTMRGVAYTAGTRVVVSADWIRHQIHREALGSVVHEEVHVVQQYGWGRRNSRNFHRPPGWLTEGIPDYIRWYLYEPQSHGADITTPGAVKRAKYDGMYRISANFLNFVTNHYDKDIVPKINAACREGKYTDDLWKQYTGKTLDELNTEWKATLPDKKQGPAV